MTWGNLLVNCSPMEAAGTLGIYLAQHCKGPFKNLAMTFDNDPKWIKVDSDDIMTNYRRVQGASWGGTTNIDAAFEKILKTALKASTPQENMPDFLIVLSDMEFDPPYWGGSVCEMTNHKAMVKKFEDAGYKAPSVVYWQVNGRGSTPVTQSTKGAVLVSGFSPTIIKSVLQAKRITPKDIMMETLMSERYDRVSL